MVKARRVNRTDVAISVSGRLDRSTAGYVTRVAEYMLDHADSRPDHVELDLTDVTTVDEVGFAALVGVAAGASQGGATVVVRCAAERTILERHLSGRVVAGEQIERMLRRHLRPVIRRRRTRPGPAEALAVRWCPGPLVGRRRG